MIEIFLRHVPFDYGVDRSIKHFQAFSSQAQVKLKLKLFKPKLFQAQAFSNPSFSKPKLVKHKPAQAQAFPSSSFSSPSLKLEIELEKLGLGASLGQTERFSLSLSFKSEMSQMRFSFKRTILRAK